MRQGGGNNRPSRDRMPFMGSGRPPGHCNPGPTRAVTSRRPSLLACPPAARVPDSPPRRALNHRVTTPSVRVGGGAPKPGLGASGASAGALSPGGIAPFMGGRSCPAWVACTPLRGASTPRHPTPDICHPTPNAPFQRTEQRTIPTILMYYLKYIGGLRRRDGTHEGGTAHTSRCDTIQLRGVGVVGLGVDSGRLSQMEGTR